jgi:hypothetical protein
MPYRRRTSTRRKKKAPKAQPVPVLRYMKLMIRVQPKTPVVWRRIIVPGDASLAELHDAIQAAFGWTERWPWLFITPTLGEVMGAMAPDVYADTRHASFALSYPRADRVLLTEVFGRRKSLRYEYGFTTSDWRVDITLEGWVRVASPFGRIMTEGEGCPLPEECPAPGRVDELFARWRRGWTAHGDRELEGLERAMLGYKPEAFNLEAEKPRFQVVERRRMWWDKVARVPNAKSA